MRTVFERFAAAYADVDLSIRRVGNLGRAHMSGAIVADERVLSRRPGTVALVPEQSFSVSLFFGVLTAHPVGGSASHKRFRLARWGRTAVHQRRCMPLW